MNCASHVTGLINSIYSTQALPRIGRLITATYWLVFFLSRTQILDDRVFAFCKARSKGVTASYHWPVSRSTPYQQNCSAMAMALKPCDRAVRGQ